MDDRPTVEELEHLYASLTRDERDQLLQELLVAAAHGGEAMASVVDAWLVDRGGRELLENLGGRRPVRIEVKVEGLPPKDGAVGSVAPSEQPELESEAEGWLRVRRAGRFLDEHSGGVVGS